MSLYGIGLYGLGLFGLGTPSGGGDDTTADTGAGIVFGGTDDLGVTWTLLRGSDPFGNPPAPRDVSGERATSDGTWNATEFYGPRSWPISLNVHSPSHAELHHARARIAAACGLAPFAVSVNEPHFGPRMAWFRRVGELMWTEETPVLARVSMTLLADDPRIFGPERTAVAQFPSSSGGLSWPATWPATWDAVVAAGVLQLENTGIRPASLVWRIDGPVTNPFLVDESTGRALRTDITLGAGEWLTIDTATHRVLANGDLNASRRDRVYGDWFDVRPGRSQVVLGGTGAGEGALVTATWSDTYI